jgi:hypothetical protein
VQYCVLYRGVHIASLMEVYRVVKKPVLYTGIEATKKTLVCGHLSNRLYSQYSGRVFRRLYSQSF